MDKPENSSSLGDLGDCLGGYHSDCSSLPEVLWHCSRQGHHYTTCSHFNTKNPEGNIKSSPSSALISQKVQIEKAFFVCFWKKWYPWTQICLPDTNKKSSGLWLWVEPGHRGSGTQKTLRAWMSFDRVDYFSISYLSKAILTTIYLWNILFQTLNEKGYFNSI